MARQPSDLEPGTFAPGAAGLAALLAEMVEQRCQGGVLEVAGEALSHRCFEGIAFHAAVVTDVAAPLGYPPEVLLSKRRAMAKLCRQVVPDGVVVVNADDPNAEMLGGVNLDARRVAFALEPVPSGRGIVDVERAGLSELTAQARGCWSMASTVSWPCICHWSARGRQPPRWRRPHWPGPWRLTRLTSLRDWSRYKRSQGILRLLPRARILMFASMSHKALTTSPKR